MSHGVDRGVASDISVAEMSEIFDMHLLDQLWIPNKQSRFAHGQEHAHIFFLHRL